MNRILSYTMKIWLTVFVFAYSTLWSQAIEEGTPPIQTFNANTYAGGPQNWSASQDEDGLMYFANNDGVLTFDGESWELIEAGDSGIIRDVLPTSDGRIWVGGSHDFGWMEKGGEDFTFHSLKDSLTKEDNFFGDAWHITEHRDEIIITAVKRLIRWKDGEASSDLLENEARLLPIVFDDGLYIHQRGEGLKKITEDGYQLVLNDSEVEKGGINFITNVGDGKLLIGTFAKGFFLFDGENAVPADSSFDSLIDGSPMVNSTILPGDIIAAGTYNNGIMKIDKRGNFIGKIDSKAGLLSDVVINLFLDKADDLWVTHNNGLSLIQLSAPYTLFDKRHGLDTEIVYDLKRFEGKIYAATYSGLFQLEPGTDDGRIPAWKVASDGKLPVWNLSLSNDSLFISQERNIERIKDGALSKVLEMNRSAGFLEKIPGTDNLYFISIKSTLNLYYLDEDQFKLIKRWQIDNAVWSMAFPESDVIWFGSARNGLLSGNLNTLLDPNDASELEEVINPETQEPYAWAYVSQTNYGVVIITDAGFFYKEMGQNIIKRIPNTPKSLGIDAYAVNFDNGGFDDKLWITYPIEQKGKRIYQLAKIIWTPEAVPQFVNIEAEGIDELIDVHTLLIEEDGELAWIGGAGGIVRHELKERPDPEPVTTLMTKKSFYQDEEQLNIEGELPEFGFPVDRAVFEFATPIFTDDNKLYQTRMVGLESHWSEPSPNHYREFTNLAEGDYTFEARSVGPSGENPSIPASYAFVVLPPWYRTVWAYVLYVVIVALAIWGYVRWRTIALRRKNLQLETAVYERTMELEETNVQLAKANSAKNDFLASVSHEIRNPMNGVVGITTLLKDSLYDSESHGEKIKQLDSTSNHLKSLLDDLLDFSALEENKMSLKPGPFRLSELLDIIQEIYLPMAAEKHLTLNTTIEGDTSMALIGDASKIRQILGNLIGNAIKYTNEGGVTLEVRVETDEEEAHIHCLVVDTGPGIPDSLQKTVFDKFQRGVFDKKSGPTGMGLGLSISSRLASMMKAKIGLKESTPEGTSFYFDLSLPVTDSALAGPADLSDQAIAALRGKRVLMVEDQQYNRLVAEELLKRLGLIVVSEESGEAGLMKFEQETFDVVLLDNNLPGISGLQVAESIRNIPGDKGTTPLIAISAHVTKRDRDNYDRVGIDATVAKPFTTSELKRTLARILINDDIAYTPNGDIPDTSGLFGLLRFTADGDIKKLIRMVTGVMKEIHEQLDSCLMHLDAKNFEEAQRATHAALSSARLIGDEGLQREAKLLHEATMENNEVEARKIITGISPMLKRISQYPIEL